MKYVKRRKAEGIMEICRGRMSSKEDKRKWHIKMFVNRWKENKAWRKDMKNPTNEVVNFMRKEAKKKLYKIGRKPKSFLNWYSS